MSMKFSEWFKSLPKKFKVLVLIICTVVLLDFSLVIGLAAGNKKSALRIKCSDGTGSSVLMALNSAAKKGRITENGYAYYKFSEEQKTLLKEFYDDYDSVAILLRLKISPTTKQCLLLDGENPLPLEFGYLRENDFTEKGKFKKQVYPNAKRIVIQGDERYAPELVDISFALQRTETIEKFIPMGFFVRSALRCYIVDAAIVPSQIGFDVSTGIPFYAFGYNGGKIDFENNQFYLDINKGKKYIPYFTTLFQKRQCLEEPYFLINGEAGEIFVAQQFYVDDIKTQTDFTKRVYGLFQIGRKLYQEQEKAKVNLKKVSYAREIAMGIKFLLHFT